MRLERLKIQGQRRSSTDCAVVVEEDAALRRYYCAGANAVARVESGPCMEMTLLCRSDLDLPGERIHVHERPSAPSGVFWCQ